MSGVLAASLASLFATTYMPFIGSQQPREDLQTAMYSDLDFDTQIDEGESLEEAEIDEEKAPLNTDA